MMDSKSIGSDTVPVRVRPPAPRRSKLCIACSDFLQKSERAHVAAPPFRKKSRSAHLLGCKRPRNGSLSLPTFCGFVPCGAGDSFCLTLTHRHSFRRSFFPNHNRCAGSRFGWVTSLKAAASIVPRCYKNPECDRIRDFFPSLLFDLGIRDFGKVRGNSEEGSYEGDDLFIFFQRLFHRLLTNRSKPSVVCSDFFM